MLIGVVSDTHNNHKNIEKIVNLLNNEKVELAIHTGDITNSKALEKFLRLNCKLIGVYGNNDRNEIGLKEAAAQFKFDFQDPPLIITKANRKIGVFHEPDSIEEFLSETDVDIIFHGHTHRFREESIRDTLIYNPGESAGVLKGKNAIGIVNLNTLEARRIFF